MTPAALYVCDPGLRSGWATWEDGRIESGILDPTEQCEHLSHWAGAHYQREDALIAFERYTITESTAKKSQQTWSLELIGAGKWIAHTHGIRFLEPLPKPAEAMGFCPDARLRAMGLWTPGKEDHERVARKHLVLQLAKHGLIRVPASV